MPSVVASFIAIELCSVLYHVWPVERVWLSVNVLSTSMAVWLVVCG